VLVRRAICGNRRADLSLGSRPEGGNAILETTRQNPRRYEPIAARDTAQPSGHYALVASKESSTFWDVQAATFDDEPDHGLRDPLVRNAWRHLLRSLLPGPPAKVADLGCGTGSLSVLLAQEGYEVVGVDLSARMIEVATRKARRAHVAVTFRQGDAAIPPVAVASVDVIVVRHVVWTLDSPADAVRRWRTLLRDGGQLVLIEGRWSTDAGITAHDLSAIVADVLPQVETRPLTNTALWGTPISDERYVLVART
jgi:SAM-dependent methyltransferase